MPIHRTPTEEEKNIIIKRHSRDGHVRCYVDDAPITSEFDFHHIRPFSISQDDNINNLAPVCKDHHRRIGILSIAEFRSRLDIEEYFKDKATVKLTDIIRDKANIKEVQNLPHELKDDKILLYFTDKISPVSLPCYQCPSTGFRYFYVVLPVEYLRNDEELQPRPIDPKRLWELYLHLNNHTQLAPAICRLDNNMILLFDGQHKTAAQIWAQRKAIECKVYISPNTRILKDTNLTAHDKLRQMPFYTSILINKWADIFKEEWTEYNVRDGEKSEAGFISFLLDKGKSRAEAKKMMESNVFDSILEAQDNRITEFIAERNRTRKSPLTTNAIKISFFKSFVTPPPLSISLEESDTLRECERLNVIKLLNLFADETLIGKWNPDRNDAAHKKCLRIYSAGSLKTISAMLRDVCAQVLNIYDAQEREEIFLREITPLQWQTIQGRLQRLFSHELWDNPSTEIDNHLRLNNVETVRAFFTGKRLTVNWILGGQGA